MWGVQPALRRGVIAITLVACVGLAAAQTGRRGGGDTDASAMDETTGSVARPGAKRAGAELALSDEQRGRIYEGVMRIADAPVAPAPAPALADALPSGVAMQDLPASLTREIPLVRGHKFVKFDDRIVVVDPASRLVVAMIPRYKLLP
jgi:Protein of unknown function (DUF1236)